MIHLVEGPDGVGKSTFASWLANRLGFECIEDRAKGRATEGQFEAVSIAYTSVLEQVAYTCDLVVDRGWISTVAFARSYCRGIPEFLSDPAARAREFGAVETIYRVVAPQQVALLRIRERGEGVEMKQVVRDFYHFSKVFEEIEAGGTRVVYVDGTSGL